MHDAVFVEGFPLWHPQESRQGLQSMVMPCSRSARSPSVNREKSIGPEDRLMRLLFTEASWSS